MSAEMVPPRRGPVILGALAWLPFVVVMAMWVVQLPDFGRLQYNDYYGILPQLVDGDRLSPNPLTYLKLKSNEHTIAIPAALYAVNARLFAGDNRGLSTVSLVFMVACFLMLYRWTPADWRGSPRVGFVVVGVLSALALTPMAAHSIVMGFSGSIWLLANALAIAAMGALAKVDRGASVWRLWPVVTFGVLGALSYSTSMSLWPALVVGAVWLGLDRRQTLVLAMIGLIVVSVYLGTVRQPEHHPDPDAGNPVLLIKYLCVYVGNAITADTARSMAIGACGLALFVVLLLWGLLGPTERRAQAAPWIMLGLFGLGNGLGTAVTRSGYGLDQALASRYATLSAFLWIGVMGGMASLIDRDRRDARWRFLAVAGLGVALAFSTLGHGVLRLRGFVQNAASQPVAELAIIHGIFDKQALMPITHFPVMPIRAAPSFKAIGHIPFEVPHQFPYGAPLPGKGAAVGRPDGLKGSFDKAEALRDTTGRVKGWAYHADVPVLRLLIVDGDGIVRGEARTCLVRADAEQLHGPGARRSGWMGWVLVPMVDTPLRAYVQLEGDDAFYPLDGEHSLAE